MKGLLFACAGGMFIALQSVANARIGQGIGTWQAAALTQLTGFVGALIILFALRSGGDWRKLAKVSPVYRIGGAMGAIVIFSNVTAVHGIGITLTVSAMLISQLIMTFAIDGNGWFGVARMKLRLPQFIGIGIMIAGVAILEW